MKVEIYPQVDSTFSMTDFNLKLFTDAESMQRLSMWFRLPCALADYLRPELGKWREYKCCLDNQDRCKVKVQLDYYLIIIKVVEKLHDQQHQKRKSEYGKTSNWIKFSTSIIMKSLCNDFVVTHIYL